MRGFFYSRTFENPFRKNYNPFTMKGFHHGFPHVTLKGHSFGNLGN
jgi:hypothetical protein